MTQVEQLLRDRYRLIERLGKSAGRQTWLAQDVTSQTQVVVKLLAFSDQVEWDNLKLFEREAQTLKQLNHPKIPRYRDYFCIDDQILWFCLVQDYIPGVSLKERLARGKRLNEAQARQIAAEVLAILSYLHHLSPPVLHRDIKPSNLIWGDNQQVYLVDFGAVQDRAAAEGATFTVVGTYGYAPLEQFGGRATAASDLYALGATLVHLLTGIAPADLPQDNARLQFVDRIYANPGFVRWLKHLTDPNLEYRFRSAEDALAALQANQAAIAVVDFKDIEPLSTPIQIRKAANYLAIKIPRRSRQSLILAKLPVWFGLTVWLLLCSAIELNTSGWFVFGWFWLLTGLGAAIWHTLPACGETLVRFDYQHFEIRWILFGLCLQRQRGRVADIDAVLQGEVTGIIDKHTPEVTLSAGVQEYSFGRLDPPLTRAECRWLIAELHSWLGLQPQPPFSDHYSSPKKLL
ncbi:serine/threonine protein kinase [Oculatella sp. LEGE 06141]|uniref:serine/threonine protein kinase n=1 Tax=Oculatella sp. LEGE 06141 TaxID=1828648 RepID=UPI001880B8B4|nr:serine/threonine-protein kinase [Oculatella sp. LEGE 06141]MBE9181998.1 serine/threonine protein kinase [Oculatella sp. LEGE 06141]